MSGSVEEWVAKAEGDYRTCQRESSAAELPNYDAAYFHAQQCVEKLMKAVLIERGLRPPKVHDLVVLAKLLATVIPGYSVDRRDLRFLTFGAVEFRYPGDTADQEEADTALSICTRLREQLLTLLHSSDD